MGPYVGDFRTGVTVRMMWDSNDGNGASITRATNGTISVYKDGGTTQSTTGVTDTEDFDSVTGIHLIAIDTSADGTFYSAGSDFHVVLSAATISGSTVNAFLGSFSLENRSALMPTTAGRKLDVSANGNAGIDWANIDAPTTAVNLSGTNIDTDQVVASVSGAVGSVTGAVGSVTGNVGGNVTGSVGSVAAGGIAATSFADNAITAAKIADGAIDAATFAADVDAEILSYLVDDATRIDASALNTASVTSIPAILVDTNELQTDWVNGGRLDLLIDGIKANTDNLPSDPADASDIAGAFSTVNTTLGTIAGYIDTEVGAIKAKTDNLPSDPADASDIAAAIASLQTHGDSAWATATGFSTHTAADVWAVGTRTLTAFAFTVTVGTNNDKTGYRLSATGVDDILDEVVEGSYTARQYFTLFASALGGKLSGAATSTVSVRDTADSKNRIVATVDADGNRSAVTLDLS